MKRVRWLTLTVLALLLLMSSSAFAFADIPLTQGKNEIEALHKRGIMNGIGKNMFAPNRPLSYAEAVTLFVKAFDLNLDHLKFIKEPKASEIFTHIKDNSWYAQAFLIAYYNGVDLPSDVKPAAAISREEFAHYLYKIVSSKGDYAVIELWHEYADLSEVKQDYQASINILLNMGIITLDKNKKFYPKKSITRAEAAIMIFSALQFIEKTPPIPPIRDEEISLSVEKMSEKVNKVTLDWGEKPSSGYSIAIDKIEFKDNIATIYYTLTYPDPNKVYLTVITRPTAETYVDAKYQIEIQPSNQVSLPYEKPTKEGNASQGQSSDSKK